MIHAGDTIENPVTGERLVFKKTSAETNGEYVLFECFVKPSGFVAAAHVHPFSRSGSRSSRGRSCSDRRPGGRGRVGTRSRRRGPQAPF